ncbi:MAG: molybdenum ABC transporter ATP-binding protein [Betaproteobacteria bacterium]
MSEPRLSIDARLRLGGFAFGCALDLPLAGVTAVFGPSGAGKTPLINLLAGLLRPDEGRIAVGDAVYCDCAAGRFLPIERRALGVVFQDARLLPHYTVEGNLRYGLRRAGARPPVADFDRVVELLGLAALLRRRPHALSGGERQRVALGRALLAQPRLLLMDEPLASLDAPRKAEILPYIERLRDAVRVPIVYVSHALDEVLRLANSLVVLDRGAVVAAGAIDAVLLEPAVARFVPSAEAGTLLHAVVAAQEPRHGLTRLAANGLTLRVPQIDLPVGTPLRVRVPARDVALALSEPHDVSVVNRFAATVEAVHVLDATYVDVRVVAADGLRLHARITREARERLALVEGMAVWCLIKSVALDAATALLVREPGVEGEIETR